ncbi:hypothetical protein JF544_00770 [Halobacillus kuroshimensis]|uniref:Lipoyl-binding domain-containing protein n=1 Tax=Halobacillus kuroshimensis TaxID=302481 RepID=A0ABS3DR76_9BACI|nr:MULTISPECIES: biotin/lipoyl-containing protein [Halobacillus]MBN8233753.1 hypothetical protein [Halobacillus kuroshimensis]
MRPEKIISPCYGEVTEILVQNGEYVYEWEPLFVIKRDGTESEVAVGISGSLKKLYIKKGDKVSPATLLAEMEDDMIISGSD